MSWQGEEEKLVAAIGDRCNGYQWLHTQSQIHYDRWNFCLTIPNIIISAITGSVTIGLSSLFPPSAQMAATTVLGGLTLSAGVLTTINQYMKSSSLAEGHRIAALAYGKLYRLILTELSMRREHRHSASDFLKLIRTEQDRLQEMSPTIGQNIINVFNATFKDVKDLERPEITGDIEHIIVPTNFSGPNTPLLSQAATLTTATLTPTLTTATLTQIHPSASSEQAPTPA
jgi:hypothetical protein